MAVVLSVSPAADNAPPIAMRSQAVFDLFREESDIYSQLYKYQDFFAQAFAAVKRGNSGFTG
jgi:hypothetical protein